MFDSAFAQRLLDWSSVALIYSISILALGVTLGYFLDSHLSIGWQAVGHYLVGAGALGIKLNYIARLAALDVLQPHPEGWVSQLGQVAPRAFIPHIASEHALALTAEKQVSLAKAS